MHWWDKQLTEYQALPVWKDFAAPWNAALVKAGGQPDAYPFWLLTARSMQYAWGANMGIQLMKEVADNVAGHRGVIINTGAAAKLGIADGDMITIATPRAQRAGARRAAPGHPSGHAAAARASSTTGRCRRRRTSACPA